MTAFPARGPAVRAAPRARPRVTLFHPAFGPVGGAEVLVLRHAMLLRELGCDVRLVTREYDAGTWQPWAAEHGVRVDCVPRDWLERKLYRSPRRWLLGSARRLAPYFAGAAGVVAYNAPAPAILATRRPPGARAVWHCNEPSRELHFAEAARTAVARAGAGPYADETAPHAPAPFLPDVAWAAQKFETYRRRLAERWRFALDRTLDVERVRRLDRIITLSEYSADSVRLVYGRAVDAVVPPVIPEPRARPRRAGIDRAGGGLHVLAHARLEPMKNVDGVLQGFARFRARVPGAHVLHVVGTGAWLDRLRARGDALGLGDAVRWHGYLDEAALAAVYARCDAFALLPLDEPFGMVFPEAAFRGLLLIGPDHGGPAEILDGGALGWTVDAFDSDALADALAAVWGLSDAEADRRRARAAAAVRARYGAATVGPRLRAALLED
ncbi:hypothetical protein tb265_30680 [Gemmatimonadetes bacterium T265]|nr:hypothetical protein tb265_30680 [Gemmatimonadetes bacterium T265]